LNATAPLGPPTPSSQPFDAFASIDPRIAHFLSIIEPGITMSSILSIAANKTVNVILKALEKKIFKLIGFIKIRHGFHILIRFRLVY